MVLTRAAALAAIIGCVLAGTAGATSPGANGSIAYTRLVADSSDIYLMQPDGSGQTPVTSDAGYDQGPSWSPDGQLILFDSDLGGGIDLYTVRPDGAERTQLTTSGNAYSGAYSPDGTKIAFMGIATGGANDVFVMSADGSELVNVTNDAGDDELPSWSPDGGRLVFDSDRDGDREVYVVNADGTGLQKLTDNETSDTFADWSPDGSRIVFGSDRTGSGEVFAMNADGSNESQLTLAALAAAPGWSPDGTRILFHGETPDGTDVFAMNADGTGVVNLTNTPGQDEFARMQPLPSTTPGYKFAGFFKPVDNPPVVNTMNAGRAIPIAFSLGGDFGLDVLAADYPKSVQVACDSSAPVSSLDGTTAASSGLTYDPSSDTYAYVWKTSSAWSDTCRQLIVRLDDGSEHVATFRFK